MVEVYLIIKLICFSLALVGTFFGITTVAKSMRELKRAAVYLTIALGFFAIYIGVGILNLYGAAEKILNHFLHLIVVALVILALVSMHQMISNVRRVSRKR